MYLKSIEIHGFKSFANKMVFEFHDGITAIVGPNGSGKSNVGDAVRWVLGEQSAKQLRGAKMEDVIFSGTEARKPQGFAYVAITLDNADHKLPTSYEEVTVARRVYRSGESEYLLNGSACRLRDVQELFLDTGIGKEGYSIIGQGQIDKILNGKPEERRELFDEAAGIVKFKKRKSTAEKNLEVERQNLCRINDILSELEKQVEPLKQQSAVAKEYLRLREELKKLDIDMFFMEYDQLHSNIKELEDKIEIVNRDYEEAKESFEQKKLEADRLELRITEKEKELETTRNHLSESKIQKEQLEGAIKVCHEQIIAAKQNDAHYKDRMDTVKLDIEAKNENLQMYQEESIQLKLDLEKLQEEKKVEEGKLDALLKTIQQLGNEIDSCNNYIFEELNANTTIKTKLQKYETTLEQSSLRKAELTQKILKSKSDEALCDEILEREQKNIEQLSEKVNQLQRENKQFEEDVKKLNGHVAELQKSQNDGQQQYHREKSRLESLKNITERYEGYGQSIRRIMEQKDRVPGIIGVVADIVKVKKQYEVAVEIALGGSIQNVVTDNEETAKQLIEFLKKNKYGRATFLPLTAMQNRNTFFQENALNEKGVIGKASSLIEADSRFHDLIEHLLGRILVVDTIEHAIAVARKYKNSLRIVTLEGELLSPGGSMSGGSYRNSSNLLSRRREIEEIEKNLKEFSQKLQRIVKEIESETVERDKKLEVKSQNEKVIQEFLLEKNTAKLKYDQAQSEKENIEIGYRLIAEENSQMEGQNLELKNQIELLKRHLQENEEKSKERESQIEEFNRTLEDKKKEETLFREGVSKVILEISSVQQKIHFTSENILREQQEKKNLEEEFTKLQQGMQEAGVQVSGKEEEIVHIQNQLLEEERAIFEIQSGIEKQLEEKEDISKQHKDFFQEREELSKQMGILDKENFRLANQKEKLSEQVEARMNYMWEEYELTYSSAYELKTDRQEELSWMKKMVGELKGKIKNLGDVNVNAIEDYKNISERYGLLHTQQEDLVKSEEALRKIIVELDNEMRIQFEEKFAQIKKQFDVVFKELFGGGKGTIELVENEDILEAGIRIIAQPPGKKLQNMMQLSGGEKALAAIALLFAIQNLKPSPFCLLDEIEAALDDSNVTRYAQYLHKLTKDTQFIVITHRRGTMEAADILYGITMQEKGVSTLVSVNLIEDELDKMDTKNNL